MIFGKKNIGTVSYMGGIMTLPEPFVYSLMQMIQFNNDYVVGPTQQILYHRATVSYHSAARNYMVDVSRGDWLLMLDTDIEFQPDILARMLNVFDNNDLNEQIDILAAVYQYKSHPHHPLMYTFNRRRKGGINLIGKWDVPKKEGITLVPVDAVGAGCLLVRRSVFKQIKKELKQNPFDIIHPYSEDLSFFKRIKKLGIKVYASPDLHVKHLRYDGLTLDSYNWDDVPLGKHIKT